MAHKYYCTHCARELNQDLVLVDMEPALTVSGEAQETSDKKEDVQKFQLLKFRLTVAEFQALVARGTVGDLDFKHLDLSVEELAGYLANEHNLNDPDIASLTLEDIHGYLKEKDAAEFGEEGNDANQTMDFTSDGGDFSMDNLFGGSQQAEETEKEVYTYPKAILALKDKIATAKGQNLTEQLLVEDLSMLRKHIGENGCIHIAVKIRTEKADDNDDILIGYYARRGDKQIVVDARICCYCSTPVFNHAGAAEHRAVAFIGEQKSGKTSTILALTHYAERAARTINPGDVIWGSSSSVPGIEVMEVVGMDDDLEADLGLYDIGVAPKKTESQQREDAYSSTLWITNSRGQKFILTLIDLPGELCKADGTIMRDRILNEFPVAMASDVFIMCFDTTRSVGSEASRTIRNTCSWASQFQELRQDYKQASVIRQPGDTTPKLDRDCVAPMMVVFTKCEELEDGVVEQQAEKTHFSAKRVDEVYSLKVEREFIDRNPVYKDVGDRIRVYENLKHAYLARLRTSPYGFPAPEKPRYLEDNSLNKNPDGSINYPRPKQVDKLMHWLMIVTGCVSAPAVFCPSALEQDRVYRLENTYVCGAQYRVRDPHGATFRDRVNEAMCRAYLFENYSDADKAYIENYNDPSWEREYHRNRGVISGNTGTAGNDGNNGTDRQGGLFGKLRNLLGW